jgi:hypothetical protein
MRGPALAQVTCPGCGAPIRIDVWSQVHKCRFCGQSSFVHRPNQTEQRPAPGLENYGHIRVPQATVIKSTVLIFVLAFIGFDVLVGVIVAIVVGVGAVAASASRTTSASPAVTAPFPLVTVVPLGPNSTSPTTPTAGPNCLKAVRCCKALQAQGTGCEMLSHLGEAGCAAQVKQLEDSARSLGKRCD